MRQTLYLIRGLPGSGKSERAKKMAAEQKLVHLEATMFFYNDPKSPGFKPRKSEESHTWCVRQTDEALDAGKSVVVANTFIHAWEMEMYAAVALKHNVELIIIETPPPEETHRQIKPVLIQRMLTEFEPVTVTSLTSAAQALVCHAKQNQFRHPVARAERVKQMKEHRVAA